MYWLNGIAGTGKSAIAKSVAYICKQDGHLGGTFFFLRNDVDHGHAKRFFPTLAVQLCSKLPSLQYPVLDLLNRDVGVPEKGLREQWKHLVLEPATGEAGAVLEGHSGDFISVAFSDTKMLISASSDKTVRVWDPLCTRRFQ